MQYKYNVLDDYFDWLYDLVCGERYAEDFSFRKLLSYLHTVEFTFLIERDINRAKEGVNLRYRFSLEREWDDVPYELDGPSSVLEMMIALAIHCEESIMDDPLMGDRTSQWFWEMITNLGLGGMYDSNFDKDYVEDVVCRFLNREYEPDGHGGLFVILNCKEDLRRVEIGYQLNWYLNTIT